jgi:catechol 2,3-dioxygenase-like lactoylglutathione lyase family enzyme
MKGRVDIITLRVEDLEAATAYYTDGLGWKPVLAVPGEVTFIQVGHGQLLALFIASGFDADVSPDVQAQCHLAHNVSSEAEVRSVVATMVAAGASLIKEPQRAVWGGFSGIVLDVAGCCWEIAHNPGRSVAHDGTVTIAPVQ